MVIAIGDWVATPDGEGEVVSYEPEQGHPYSVMLDRIGADASADNLRVYTAGELQPARPPQWKVLRDQEAETGAIQTLASFGYFVRRQVGGVRDGWWIITNDITGIETASMDNLPALVKYAEAASSPQGKRT